MLAELGAHSDGLREVIAELQATGKRLRASMVARAGDPPSSDAG